VRGPLFLRDLAFSTVFVFLAAFSAHVVLVVGTRNFARLLVGRYRKPRELRATFMFVDVRHSTRLAEQLGHERYSALLRDFFAAVSPPIHDAKGEVYQYIGDEVVIVWPGRHGADSWISCFAGMRRAMGAGQREFEANYGVVPEFKAGVHTGDVVVTEVGTLQRAHVYHGDVLNTAARIQAQCNEVGFDLLASEEALALASSQDRDGFVGLGALSLRGKEAAIEVFGLAESRIDRSPA
jgi:adenylate cyclase